EPNSILRNPGRGRHMSARDMRAFIGDPDIDDPIRTDRDEAGMRLDIALMHRGNGEVMHEDLVRAGKGASDIAVMHLELRDYIGNRWVHAEFAVNASSRAREYLDCFRMDAERGWPHRIAGAEDCRQLRVLDV